MYLVPENIDEAIKHLKPRTKEEIASLPEPKEYNTLDDITELLTPRQQRWVDIIMDGSNEIRRSYDKKWWRNGGWNGMMDAIDDYLEKKRIKTPNFDNLEGFINIYSLIMNEI